MNPYNPINWFRKAAPTAITPDASEVDATAWTVELINQLSDEYATLAKPYTDNPVVRAAVESMRRNATKATLQVGYYDEDGGFEPVDHPLCDMWLRPSAGETDASIIEHFYNSILENGNGYAYFTPSPDGFVREIQPIPFGWIQTPEMGIAIGEIARMPIRGWDYLRGYDFTADYQYIGHIKTGRSINSMAFGRSPLEAVKAELALIKMVSIYETTILSRSGVPSWLISLTGPSAQAMGREQIAVLQNDFKRATSGRSVGRPFVHKGEMKLETPGFSPKDLSVAELTEIAVARVCGVLGWAPMSLKQPDTGKTYSNLVEANKASWRDAVIPFLEQIAGELTKAVRTLPFAFGDMRSAPDAEIAVRFDTSQIEELAVDQKEVAARAVALYQAGIVTVDEARTMLGLGDMSDAMEDETPQEEAADDTPDTQDTPDTEDNTDTSVEDTPQ